MPGLLEKECILVDGKTWSLYGLAGVDARSTINDIVVKGLWTYSNETDERAEDLYHSWTLRRSYKPREIVLSAYHGIILKFLLTIQVGTGIVSYERKSLVWDWFIGKKPVYCIALSVYFETPTSEVDR